MIGKMWRNKRIGFLKSFENAIYKSFEIGIMKSLENSILKMDFWKTMGQLSAELGKNADSLKKRQRDK